MSRYSSEDLEQIEIDVEEISEDDGLDDMMWFFDEELQKHYFIVTKNNNIFHYWYVHPTTGEMSLSIVTNMNEKEEGLLKEIEKSELYKYYLEDKKYIIQNNKLENQIKIIEPKPEKNQSNERKLKNK